MTDTAIAAPAAPPHWAVTAGRLFVIFMGPSLGGLAPLGLALDQPALAAHFGGGAQGMLQAGTVFTAPSLAIIVGAPLGGYLAERFGYRLTMLVALLVYSITGVAGLAIDGYLPLFATRLVLGLASGAVMAVYLALASAWYEGPARSKVLGFAVASSSIVGAAALALGGKLVDLGGWRAPFAMYLVGFLTLAVAYLTVHGPFHKHTKAARAPGSPGQLQVIAQFWPVYLALLITSIGTFMPSAGGPFLLKANGITGATQAGYILSIGSISAIFTAAAYGFVRRWISDWGLFFIIPSLMGLGLAIAPAFYDWQALLAIFLLIGLGTGFKAPTAASILMANSPPDVRAAAAGLNFSCIFLGQFLGPFVLRALSGPFGIHAAFIGTGAMLMLAAVAIWAAGIGKEKPQVETA
ncbi:MAG TPA: MFS transporter [Alphaproteobacteria bacterium]|jgi:MFS family permease|nr:MFS transporter [Alphaproteobacteria bacterium]